ncbi:MAG: hypothetical protein FJ271_10055 [Planctomycetes bacterium]|nr:hypothetical protein [Planctomycetota bacterium]
MILLYTLVLLILALAKFLVQRRVAFLEWRHTRLARGVNALLNQAIFKQGNSNKPNPCQLAQQQYLLGHMVLKKDNAERKLLAWLGVSEKLARAVDAWRKWKGKKLPYTLGALDVWLFLYLIDYFGAAEILGTRRLIQMVTSLWSN